MAPLRDDIEALYRDEHGHSWWEAHAREFEDMDPDQKLAHLTDWEHARTVKFSESDISFRT